VPLSEGASHDIRELAKEEEVREPEGVKNRVRNLSSSGRWHVLEAEKTDMWTIKSRNDRTATHLTITNYVPEATHRSHSVPGG
jgi:hypothetical protein